MYLNQSICLEMKEFHKTRSCAWQNEFRIAIDFTQGKFSPAMFKEVPDFAKLTFPRKIEINSNPLSVSDRIYFEIGDIRDICQCVEVEELFSERHFIIILEIGIDAFFEALTGFDAYKWN